MINEVVIEKLYLAENENILVFDPDNLLASEDIIEYINQVGFSIVNYEDPEVFRYYYEENIRIILDQGKSLANKVLIRYTEEQTIPYDIRSKCFFVELTLREIFPKLSYTVIKELYNEVFDKLFKVYSNYSGPILGNKGTKEFILKNVYGVIPETVFDFQKLVEIFIPIYYGGEELPRLIAEYAAEVISSNGQLKHYPINAIVSGKGSCFRFLQEQWELFIRRVNGEAVETVIDFGNYQIRAYIDNLFQENYLTPIKQLDQREYPSWMQSGVIYDIAGSTQRRYENCLNKIIMDIQKIRSYKDWFSIATLWAEVLMIKNNQIESYSIDSKKYKDAGKLLNEHFKGWLLGNYNLLASLSYAKAPVMVHKIPWNINHRFPKQENKKVAMIVMDGMSLDDWYIIKETINESNRYIFEESLCFAWIPTMTSVSRQSIFSGEIPANYSDTLLSTNHDEKHWKKFWRNIGYPDNNIAFKRNIKEFTEDGLEDILNDNKLRVLGLVINMVDDIMHGQQLSIEGMHQDIRLWANKGSLVRFIEKLFSKGFEVFITSDHGNIGATGQGTLQEGLAVESQGERVRFYNSELNCDTIMSKYKAIRWEASGLPPRYNYVISEENLAFVKEGKKIVAHGGLALEEVIVPFVHLREERHNAG